MRERLSQTIYFLENEFRNREGQMTLAELADYRYYITEGKKALKNFDESSL